MLETRLAERHRTRTCSLVRAPDYYFTMEKNDFSILIADDDEIARDVITTLLSREGYRTAPVPDGLAAIERLKNERFHLVITDLMMPGADGIEVLKFAVRNDHDIAVVILTAYGTLDTALQAIKEGAYDYLTKPFKTLEITVIAERAFQRAQLIADNRDLKEILRDSYGDLALLKIIAASNSPELTTSWLSRIDRLRSMNVLDARDADNLTEKLIRGNILE